MLSSAVHWSALTVIVVVRVMLPVRKPVKSHECPGTNVTDCDGLAIRMIWCV